jgi:hypothetical protein
MTGGVFKSGVVVLMVVDNALSVGTRTKVNIDLRSVSEQIMSLL